MALFEKIPQIKDPSLIDRVIIQIQEGLVNSIPWLDYAFGKCQRITKELNGRNYYIPTVYAGNEQYQEVSPDSKIGNFSFFVLGEPQIYNWEVDGRGDLDLPFSLIFWFDLRKVNPLTYNERNTEAIKEQILRLMNRDIRLRDGRYTISKVWERSENIYREFNYVGEIDNQFLMQPYAGFRFDGNLSIETTC